MSQLRDTRKQRMAAAPDSHDKFGRPPVPYQKSLLLAYFFWMTGWWCGAHHWYLERHSQAFLWMTSFGGFFIGSGLDFFYMPGYVSEANGQWAMYPSGRGFGFGAYFLYRIYAGFYSAILGSAFGFAGTVVGVFVALPAICFGRRRLALPTAKSLVIGLALALIIRDGEVPLTTPQGLVAFASGVLGAFQGALPDKEHTVGRFSMVQRFGIALLIMSGIVATSFFLEVTTVEGERSTLAEQFTRLFEMLYNAGHTVYNMGWEGLFNMATQSPDTKDKHLSTLGLKGDATLKEVKSAYKQFAKKYHPDVCRSSSLSADECKEKMQQVNEAFSRLKDIYGIRGARVHDE